MRTLPLHQDTATAAALFHALSDPTRLEILRCVSACERCVCDLTTELHAAQSRLSFHLRVLKEAGLIRDRRAGRWVYYSVVPEALEQVSGFIELLQKGGASEAAACCG